MIHQFPLETGTVGAHTRCERESEVGAGQPLRDQLELQQRQTRSPRLGALVPLLDRLDVVESPALAGHETEVVAGTLEDLLLAERKEGPRERGAHHRQIPGVRLAWSVTADLIDRDHVPTENHRLQVKPPL